MQALEVTNNLQVYNDGRNKLIIKVQKHRGSNALDKYNLQILDDENYWN